MADKLNKQTQIDVENNEVSNVSDDIILAINGLRVSYGPIEAIKGVDMQVKRGQVVTILGANGAGKSTIIKTVGGLNKASGGDILFEGKSITRKKTHKVSQSGIIMSPEGRLLFPSLNVEENLMTGTFTHKGRIKNQKEETKKNLETVYKYFPILLERKKQRASTLSGGEQQMLAIGRALMGSPKLLLLDEPSLGLAPLIIKNIFEIIKKIALDGTTILIVEQNALQTLKIADYAYLMELGKIKTEGFPSDILNNEELISAYLGG